MCQRSEIFFLRTLTIISILNAVECSSVITMISKEETVVTEDAIMVWYLRPDQGKEVKSVVLHNDSINGPVLWYNHMKDSPEQSETEESSFKLKKRFGDRVKVSWTPFVDWFSVRVNNVTYDDSTKFVLRVSFRKKGQLLADEFDSQPIELIVKGLKLIGDGLASYYTFEEGTTPSFSILIAGNPTPNITWKFGGKTGEGESSQALINKEMRLYEYSYTLEPLEVIDCGKYLTYEVKSSGKFIYRSLTNKAQKARIEVIFTPEKLTDVKFHGLSVGDLYCQQFSWNPVEAGECGSDLQYNGQLLNGTDWLQFRNISNTFLRVCNANAARKFKVMATYKENDGEETSIDLYIEPPENTPTSLPTPVPNKDTSAENKEEFPLWLLIVCFVAGFVLATIIMVIACCVYMKKKYPEKEEQEGDANTGEEDAA